MTSRGRPSLDSLVATASTLGATLLRAKLVALFLGPGGMGLFSQVSLLQGLGSSLALFGVGPALTQHLAAARARGDADGMGRLVAGSAAVSLGLAAVLAAGVALSGPWLASVLLGDASYASLLPLVAFAVAAGAVSQYGLALWNAFRATRLLALGNLVSSALGIGAFWAALQAGGGTLPAAVAGLAAWMAAAAVVAVATLPGLLHGFGIRRFRPDLRAVLPLYRIGLVALGLMALDQVATLWIRTDVVRTLGAEANGLYQAAASLSQLSLGLVGTYVSGYAFARACETDATGQAALTRTTTVRVAGVLSLLGGAYVLLGAPLLSLLLSRDFLPARAVFPWQTAGDLLMGLGMALGLALLPARGGLAWAAHGVGTIAVQVAVYALLPESLGLHRVALAWTARGLLYAILGYALVRPALPLRIDAALAGLTLGGLALLGAMALLSSHGAPGTAAGLLLLGGWIAVVARVSGTSGEPAASPCAASAGS